nr:MAG TPA: Bacterial DNA-binding protein [Caudoviricetes sp.]
MIKTELINAIAERIEGAKKGDITLILDTYAEVITDTLKKDSTEAVPVGKLGKFKVKTVPERRGKIMMGDRKGEEYVTPQHDEITFKMSKTAKQL